MPFTKILKDLVENTPRAIGAIVVDWEGEAVQEFCRCDPYQVKFIAAHQEIILKRLRLLHEEAGAGETESFSIGTSTHHLIIGPINREYFLALQVDKNPATALAMHYFQTALAALRREF